MTACAYLQDHSQEPALLNCDGVFISNAGHRGPAAKDTTTTGTGRDDGKGDSSSLSAESSSLADFTIKSSAENSTTTKGIKRVSWDRIYTREFTLVVGDHPMCQDSLPVSLGWQYNDSSCSTRNMSPIPDNQIKNGKERSSSTRQQQQIQLSERRQSYVFPRRLSYEERRERLVSVSNLTLDQIKNDEIDLVLRNLKESWEKEDSDNAQNNNDVMMEPVQDNYDFYPWADENLMELDDIDVVSGIDVDFSGNIDEYLGDLNNFEWTDNDTGG
jgi:hypothetical protein